MPSDSPLVRVVHELCVEPRAETLRHHILDDSCDFALRIALTVHELDGHSGVVVDGFVDDALDLTVDGERGVAAGDKELEQEFGAYRERSGCLDECPTARDVLGVVGEERVEPLVLDLELDRTANVEASLAIGFVGHAPPYQERRMSVGQARAAIGEMSGRRRLWTWTGLAVVMGVGLGWVPLFGVLGFELATAVALFAAVMGLDVGSALARELQRMPVVGVARAEYAGRTMVRSTA